MNYKDSTGKSIQESFNLYHQNNPHVFEKFERLALDAISKGKSRISFKMMMNVIRWDHFMTNEETTVLIKGKQERFKINDAYGSRYARIFIDKYPNYAEKIELRELRS